MIYKSGLTVTVSKSETTKMYTHFENMHRIINIGKATDTFCNCEGSVDDLVDAYNKGVQSVINYHAPSC